MVQEKTQEDMAFANKEAKYKHNEERKKVRPYVQWAVGLSANSLLFTYGMQSGWMSPMAQTLQSSSSPTGEPLSDSSLGWVASTVPITALVFVPVFVFLADRIGRKACILITTVPQEICWLLKLWAPNTMCLVIARICCGVGAAGCYTVISMYNIEISQRNNRGAIGSLLIVGYNLGILVIYALGAFLDYYTVLYVVTGVPALSFVLMLRCPESPGFLVKVGKEEEARKALSLLRQLKTNDNLINNRIDAMKRHNEYFKTLPSLSFLVIFRDKGWRKAAFLASILLVIQAFSGNLALISYGAKIIGAAGTGVTPELQTLSFPAVMMTGSFVAFCIIERFGRRVILTVTYLISAASLTSFGLLLQFSQGSENKWLPLLAIVITMFSFSGGVQPVPFIVMAELFNIQIRAKLTGMVVAEAWIASFVQLAAFAPITATLGMHANFYCFAVVHLIGLAVVRFVMPETRGKNIEDIEIELRK